MPRFELADEASQHADGTDQQDDAENLYGAAYEEVTYRDSTDDGFDGEMLEGRGRGNATDFELVGEAERIVTRLMFLTTLARLRKLAAVASLPGNSGGESSGHAACPDRDDALAGWLQQATATHGRLLNLLEAIHNYHIPPPRGTHEALVEYDQRRGIQEMLTEEVIAACVEMADAGRMVRAALQRHPGAAGSGEADSEAWEESSGQVLRAVLRGDVAAVHDAWDDLIGELLQQPLLYVALPRGGNPQRIVASRSIQCVLRRLLAYLPRLGLLRETGRLIETIQDMELDHPVGPGAVTEFDQMFRIGCTAITWCLVVSSEDWDAAGGHSSIRPADADLINCLEQTSESLLRCWLVHSRGVRLSVLETVENQRRWRELKRFIESYGADLFSQTFMSLGNLRAILHEGVDAYLQSLEDESDAAEDIRLLRELGGPISHDDAVRHLGTILEAVMENYSGYIDYNSTTTQSDRGEMLYTLLDFLRLRVSYDRVAWNLQPLVLAHDVLVRCGREEAAEIWRTTVSQRTGEIADDHLKRLVRISRKYGMQLPSIADRLAERFVRPLAIDRLRALVRPAIEELRVGRPSGTFARLEEQIAQFIKESAGAGFEVPQWLDALEQEADRVLSQRTEDDELPDPLLQIPQVRLSAEEAERQIKEIRSEE